MNPFFPTFSSGWFHFQFRVVGLYFSLFFQILITHYVSKQWRPWLDASLCGVWLGSALFAHAPLKRRNDYYTFYRSFKQCPKPIVDVARQWPKKPINIWVKFTSCRKFRCLIFIHSETLQSHFCSSYRPPWPSPGLFGAPNNSPNWLLVTSRLALYPSLDAISSSTNLPLRSFVGLPWLDTEMEYKNLSWAWGWDRKFRPEDHRLASRGLPSDVKRWLLGTDFSIPSSH